MNSEVSDAIKKSNKAIQNLKEEIKKLEEYDKINYFKASVDKNSTYLGAGLFSCSVCGKVYDNCISARFCCWQNKKYKKRRKNSE